MCVFVRTEARLLIQKLFDETLKSSGATFAPWLWEQKPFLTVSERSVMQIHNNGCASACVGSMEHKSKQRSFHCGRPIVLRCHDLNLFASGVWASLSCMALSWGRVLRVYFNFWGNEMSTGNAAGCVFTTIYRHKCVCVPCLGSGRKQALQNPGLEI